MNATTCRKASADLTTKTCKTCGQPATMALIGVRSKHFGSLHINVEEQQRLLAIDARRAAR